MNRVQDDGSVTSVEDAVNHRLPSKTLSPFLFPGPVMPGTPRHARPGATTDLGIPGRTSRNSALRILTEGLPTPVVAELFGLHIHAVSRCADYTRPCSAHYLDARPNGSNQR